MVVKRKKATRAKKPVARKKTKVGAKRKVASKKATRKAAKPKARKATKARKTTKARKPAKKKAGKRRGSGLTKISYSLSPELQAIVGSKTATRPEVVKKLWAYIKAKKCQDTKNKRMIVPDAKLAQVLGSRPVDMMKMAGLISKHIK